jgi:hypothetical protein
MLLKVVVFVLQAIISTKDVAINAVYWLIASNVVKMDVANAPMAFIFPTANVWNVQQIVWYVLVLVSVLCLLQGTLFLQHQQVNLQVQWLDVIKDVQHVLVLEFVHHVRVVILWRVLNVFQIRKQVWKLWWKVMVKKIQSLNLNKQNYILSIMVFLLSIE